MTSPPPGATRRPVMLTLSALAVLSILAISGLVRSAWPASAAVASITLDPVADTFVDSNRPTINFGSRSSVYADNSPVLEGLVQFEVPSLDSVDSASLRVYVRSGNSAGISVASTDSNWTESEVTWESAPTAGATLDSGPADSGTWVTLDVTRAVVPGSKVVSLMITTPGNTRVALRSREGGAATAPQLVIQGATTATSTATTTSSAPASSSAPPSSSPPGSSPPASSTPPGADPVLAAAGDVACDPTGGGFNGGVGTASSCHQMATSDLLLDIPNLTAVAALGDLQYDDSAASKWTESYDPSWGRLKSITHPAVGNHEYLTPGAAPYFDYFGAAAGGPDGYYSYDLDSWHVVVLNSNCSEAGGCSANSPQGAWLQADLKAHPAKCTLAYWHHPVFSSGLHGNNPGAAPLWDILAGAGAEAVLVGHDHHYERFAPQTSTGVRDDAKGIREFVVGTGGKNHYPVTATIANSQVTNDDTFGVLQLTLHPDSYDWKFLPEPGGTFTDSGSQACH